MEINALDIVYHVINIGVLFVILRLLLYKPVSKFMQARTSRIDAQLQHAAELQNDMETEKASYDKLLQNATEEAKKYLLESNQQANIQATAILEKANIEAEQIIFEAEGKAQQEERAAVLALREQITKMSISLAEQILQREVHEQDNRNVIDAFFKQAV